MTFIDRERELARLDSLMKLDAGLAVLYGRRRIGKTRLLREWVARHNGLYSVADLSSPEIQRRYLTQLIGTRIAGFADLVFSDWSGLLSRLARDAATQKFRGPIVFDELPYLVVASPELPSVLQRWIDHEARPAGLIVAFAGSVQRMMQGLVLDQNAPLFGRADQIFELSPLQPSYLRAAFQTTKAVDLIAAWAAWGGVPRYWELAARLSGSTPQHLDQLVLDPMGPLHNEPDRLLLEDIPPAIELRPILDAIGSGAHRLSEIGGRVGRPTTSLSRSLTRLQGMGLIRREVPFGEADGRSKRSIYRIADPFTRMWFRVVAPNRSTLAVASSPDRLLLLGRHWPQLVASTWEELCRTLAPRIDSWGPAARWWYRNEPEWDVVSESLDQRRLLLGEARWSERPLTQRALQHATSELRLKSPPPIAKTYSEVVRTLFVNHLDKGVSIPTDVRIVVADDLLADIDGQ